MYHFCTYFDKNYLLRGITLYRSLLRNCEIPFRFYVLCLDQETFDILVKLKEESIVPVRLKCVELWDKELLAAKRNRSMIEYYFTLSPVFPLYVLEHFYVDIVTYLDADLMFFSSPKAIYDELGNASIFITEHGFPNELKHREMYGVFNVQCQVFRGNNCGLKCLRHWREKCLEWCYDRLENGRFADQKYLDEWPTLYGDNIVISKNSGVGVAPWNIANQNLTIKNCQYFMDSQLLVFYHFHGFKGLQFNFIKTGLGCYEVSCHPALKALYHDYFRALTNEKGTTKILTSKGIRSHQSFFKQLYLLIREKDLLWLKK